MHNLEEIGQFVFMRFGEIAVVLPARSSRRMRAAPLLWFIRSKTRAATIS